MDEIRVLHVDDEPDFADLTANYLERVDDRFAVETATSVAAGLRALDEGDPVDCVVSDYDMPERSGIEFLRIVREDYPDLPFVLFTGKGSEAVASVVSHDLRNPLHVAAGNVDVARESCDSPRLDDAANALDRMETLVDDLLAVAREGQAVEDPVPVDLGDAAASSWRTVETADATLAVETDATVRADESRLGQLFENLFRNSVEHGSTGSRAEPGDAIEHGVDEGSDANPDGRPDANPDGGSDADGSPLSITVGLLDDGDGFYVEDDGVGIPADERDRVFEGGYSSVADGTGFGLTIVREVAEAHGWSVAATAGDAGGARFEVTGASVVE
ncbi:ATP-binding response regulator [Halorubrum amylolyticum]|uniref:ATP-binding response regulator n=1 Tax=Halorubrum amylolyticum TaxID=2508724 RepID=UPI001008AE90|nr:hybrid sensor histidine kinase/response regulator [Halorubrum amylolyticum]